MPVDSKRLLSAIMDGIDPGCDSRHSQGYYNILNVRLDPCIQHENINYLKRAFFNCVVVKHSFMRRPLSRLPCRSIPCHKCSALHVCDAAQALPFGPTLGRLVLSTSQLLSVHTMGHFLNA